MIFAMRKIWDMVDGGEDPRTTWEHFFVCFKKRELGQYRRFFGETFQFRSSFVANWNIGSKKDIATSFQYEHQIAKSQSWQRKTAIIIVYPLQGFSRVLVYLRKHVGSLDGFYLELAINELRTGLRWIIVDIRIGWKRVESYFR